MHYSYTAVLDFPVIFSGRNSGKKQKFPARVGNQDSAMESLQQSVNDLQKAMQVLKQEMAKMRNCEGTNANPGNNQESLLTGSTTIGSKLGCPVVNTHTYGVTSGKIRGRNSGIGDGKTNAYKVFDKKPPEKLPKQEGSISEYYDAFVSFANKEGWNESLVVIMFIWGLQPEIKRRVSFFKPSTLHDAYSWAYAIWKSNHSKTVESVEVAMGNFCYTNGKEIGIKENNDFNSIVVDNESEKGEQKKDVEKVVGNCVTIGKETDFVEKMQMMKKLMVWS